MRRAEAGEGVLNEGRITVIQVRVTHHEYFASSGLQDAGAEGGGGEAGEGELRQDYSKNSNSPCIFWLFWPARGEGGGREADEGVLRQDYINNLYV